MRRFLILALALASALTCSGDSSPHRKWMSPDGRWLVTCDCKGTWQPDSCSIALSRPSNGKVFFTHHTSDRYIKATWSADSNRCVLLDAPDNANSYLWLFRVQGRDIATERLDYEKISERIEASMPALRREEPAVTRSGIEKIEWESSAALRLHITYNNVLVLVVVDITKPNSPSIRVLSHSET
jgi:hypothetical protein